MYCQKCGNGLLEQSRFCNECGMQVGVESKQNNEEKPVNWRHFFLGVAALVSIFILIGMAVENQNRKSGSSDNVSSPVNNQPAIYQAPYKTHTQQLVTPAFIVNAGSYVYWEINVDESMRNFKVKGRFTASGGSGNDIYAFITDSDGFVNFKNGHQFRVWYDSRKVTIGNLDVQLSPGSYYLVFSNRMAWISNKAVNADINFSYEYLFNSSLQQLPPEAGNVNTQ